MNKKTKFLLTVLYSHSYIFLFSLLTITTLCSVEPKFEACQPKTCGNNQSISYPFYIDGIQEPFCGYPGFALSCGNNGFPILNLSNTSYFVDQIFYNNQTLRVSNTMISRSSTTNNKGCLPLTQNLTLPKNNQFILAPNQKEVILFFGCNLSLGPTWLQEHRIRCYEASSVLALYKDDKNISFVSGNCKGGGVADLMVENGDGDEKGNIEEVLRNGFLLNWTASDCSLCRNTGGRCGFDSDMYLFRCYCADRVHAWKCDTLPVPDQYGNQVQCPPSFHCGHLDNITFPFTVTQHPHCGLFVISNCDINDPSKPKNIQLENNGKLFWVISLVHNPPTSPNITLEIRDYSLYNLLESRSCEVFSNNYTLPTKFPFGSISIDYSQTMFKCNRSLHVKPPKDVHNYTRCSDYDLYYKPSLNRNDKSLSSLVACTIVILPIKDVANAEDPFTFITSDIITEVRLSYECVNCYNVKRGQCHLDSSQKFSCINGYVFNFLFSVSRENWNEAADSGNSGLIGWSGSADNLRLPVSDKDLPPYISFVSEE
ncbi:unnamed protein product [Lupinus luteus]|uniref:non-specific serine/threonine protein kinase n=1 Tax=Lupinus luteus TaxID=3873 RepID=A0AAV1X4F4_LUPLU